MSTSQEGAPEGAERRASIERMLAQYPDISAEQISGLVAWFVREASALDVGLIASNEAIRPGYARFRSDHLDRFRIKDAVYAALFAGVVIAVVVLMGAWHA